MRPRIAPYLVPLGLAAVAGCGEDGPLDPVLPAAEPIAEAARDEGALAIRDMLGDPLFQAAVAGLSESDVAGPLSQGLAALEAGDPETARPLVARMSAAALVLSHRTDPDPTASMYWSVLERFFEAAGLL